MVESCINLKERFGRKYRVVYEESYYAERPEYRREEAPWLQIIPCRWGHLFSWDADRLAASVDGHTKIAEQVRRLSGAEIVQDGYGGEVTIAFTPDRFDEVAAVMQPKRRPQRPPMTDEERAAAIERLRPYWFTPQTVEA